MNVVSITNSLPLNTYHYIKDFHIQESQILCSFVKTAVQLMIWQNQAYFSYSFLISLYC